MKTIRVTRKLDQWKALLTAPSGGLIPSPQGGEMYGTGKTFEEAIGNLLVSWKEEFHVDIWFPIQTTRDASPEEREAMRKELLQFEADN